MKYPHYGPGPFCQACAAVIARDVEGCPRRMGEYIAELERLQQSIIKVKAEGYEAGKAAERAAVCTWLFGERDHASWCNHHTMPGAPSCNCYRYPRNEIALAIESGKHHNPAEGSGEKP